MIGFVFGLFCWLSFNTVLGLAIGLAGGARPVRWDWPWVWRVREGSRLDRLYIRWAFAISAQTFGLVVLFAPSADRPGLLAEERVHVIQQLLLGPLFWVLYGIQFLVAFARLGDISAAYRAIGLERAAHPRYWKDVP